MAYTFTNCLRVAYIFVNRLRQRVPIVFVHSSTCIDSRAANIAV